MDPALDARHAAPVWQLRAPNRLRVETAHDPEDAPRFDVWRMAGQKRLSCSDEFVGLAAEQGPNHLQAQLGPDIGAESAFELFARVDARPHVHEIDDETANRWLAGAPPAPSAREATRTGRFHFVALQALDGRQGGASHRQIAVALFGVVAVRARWSVDGELRAQLRYVLRRASALVNGEYRQLAGLPPREGEVAPI